MEPVRPDLSVVIPARNEALRLPHTLRRAAAARQELGLSMEIVVADDGSEDRTAEMVQDLASPLDVRVVSLGHRRGVGLAVRTGMLMARGERVLLCDADGPVPFSEILPLWRALERGFDVAVGSRRLTPASIKNQQPPHRVLMGRAWSLLVHCAVPVGILDTQCGFKLFTRDAAQRIFSRVESTSFTFHVEALVVAQSLDLTVVEIPVSWSDIAGSRVNLLRDPITMVADLGAVAWRHHRRSKLSLQLGWHRRSSW